MLIVFTLTIQYSFYHFCITVRNFPTPTNTQSNSLRMFTLEMPYACHWLCLDEQLSHIYPIEPAQKRKKENGKNGTQQHSGKNTEYLIHFCWNARTEDRKREKKIYSQRFWENKKERDDTHTHNMKQQQRLFCFLHDDTINTVCNIASRLSEYFFSRLCFRIRTVPYSKL